MNSIIIIPIISIIAALVIVLLYRNTTRKTMLKLSAMVDDVLNNKFKETIYDESLMSSLEVKLFRYISASQQSEMSLEDEKEKIKVLISDISHQSKAPIANVLLYAQLLCEDVEMCEDSRKMSIQIKLQAERLNFLVDGLVKLSRLESGLIKITKGVNEVDEVIMQAFYQIKPQADSKQIEIKYQKTNQTACFDPKWTLEAIYNILENAVKYTQIGGKVEITLKQYDSFCRIGISDTGIGIAENEIEKIFGRFYRSPAVALQAGVGIGLYLAREIILAQGGYIKVKSIPNEGSVFSIFIAG